MTFSGYGNVLSNAFRDSETAFTSVQMNGPHRLRRHLKSSRACRMLGRAILRKTLGYKTLKSTAIPQIQVQVMNLSLESMLQVLRLTSRRTIKGMPQSA